MERLTLHDIMSEIKSLRQEMESVKGDIKSLRQEFDQKMNLLESKMNLLEGSLNALRSTDGLRNDKEWLDLTMKMRGEGTGFNNTKRKWSIW